MVAFLTSVRTENIYSNIMVKQIVDKTVDFWFESRPPHNFNLKTPTKWKGVLKLKEHEKAGAP